MKIFFYFLFFSILSTTSYSFVNPKVKIENFFINKYEITIQEYQNYADKNNISKP